MPNHYWDIIHATSDKLKYCFLLIVLKQWTKLTLKYNKEIIKTMIKPNLYNFKIIIILKIPFNLKNYNKFKTWIIFKNILII